MPYARLDDRYDDHRKIKRALRREPAAVALHVMAITYANRHNTDGEVDREWVEEKLALMPYRQAQRERIVALLVELNLFEEADGDVFVIHDFLDWNLSREQREVLAENGRRGGRSHRGFSPPGSDGSSKGSSKGLSGGLSDGSSGGLSTPSPTPTPTPRPSQKSAQARELFDYWRDRCKHPTTIFTADRRSKIEARLRDGYTVEQIRTAIDGAARAAFVDDRGKKHDDIGLICRNGEKLEAFIDRASLAPVHRIARNGEMSPAEQAVVDRARARMVDAEGGAA